MGHRRHHNLKTDMIDGDDEEEDDEDDDDEDDIMMILMMMVVVVMVVMTIAYNVNNPMSTESVYHRTQ